MQLFLLKSFLFVQWTKVLEYKYLLMIPPYLLWKGALARDPLVLRKALSLFRNLSGPLGLGSSPLPKGPAAMGAPPILAHRSCRMSTGVVCLWSTSSCHTFTFMLFSSDANRKKGAKPGRKNLPLRMITKMITWKYLILSLYHLVINP